MKGSCRFGGGNLCPDESNGIVAENDTALPGKTGIDEEPERADAALQWQELDIDYFRIVEAARINGAHRCP
jgi:hypothetical protein